MKITHVPTPTPQVQTTPKDWLEAAAETVGFLLVCAAFFFVMTAVYVYGGGG